jgi:hypothetical protein
MTRSTMRFLILGFCVSAIGADEPQKHIRPITASESVLAVYREDWGLRPGSHGPAIILVVWPDGYAVWSSDRVKGGAPYRAGRVDSNKVADLLKQFEAVGLFADEKLNRGHFGPDSQYTTVHIKSGNRQVKMQSWHELFEMSDNLVADQHGVSVLEGRRRLEVLRKVPADYLFFRFVWSETRLKLSNLIPIESVATSGRPVMDGGVLSWQETAAKPKPRGTGDPTKK